MASDDRKRNFATVVYPESAPDDWLDFLQELCIPCFISPLHDSDCNPDGEIKKPHYHVLLMFEGKKSDKQVKEIFDCIGGVGSPAVHSIRGYARYLCHLDNPEKTQYLPEDVICFGGADYSDICSLPSDRYKIIGDIIDYCEDNYIYSYAQLLTYARFNRGDWFRILCDSGTFVIREYLKSKKRDVFNPYDNT